MNGCSNICDAVIRLEGYHFKHSAIKSMPSAGQLVIIVSNAIGRYSGKFIPFLAACFRPYGQFLGVPNTEVILLIWSSSEFPKKSGFIKYIYAMMQPIAKTSTGAEYAENLNKS